MRKTFFVLAIISCFLFVSMLKNYKISVKGSPREISVPDDYPKIQLAINNANEGDIVFVHNGTYYENIVINKRITLIGESRDSTIIDGSETESVIFIKDADNVIIKEFTLRKSGMVFYNSSGVLIERSNGSIVSNNIISTNYNGISLYSSTNIVVSSNVVFNNLYGISLFYSVNTLIYDNNFSKNFYNGIMLYGSSDNVISANTIINNLSGGMRLFVSRNNVIYHNNFDNSIQVWSGDSINVWCYNGEGNYWSDYFGEDLNEDGIGDIPYGIPDTSQIDSAPLMGMFSKFNIAYKYQIYEVCVISNSSICDFQFQVGLETGNKIISFKPLGNASTIGFCRIMIPTGFMNYPYIVLLGKEEISPSFLDVSNETHVYFYFTYLHKDPTITIISSEWYTELLNIYHNLNVTYNNLLNIYAGLLYNYTVLLSNYTQLQRNFEQLNASLQYFYDLNVTFHNFLGDYAKLQEDFRRLNSTYYVLTDLYGQLQINFGNLNLTYQNLLNALVLLSGNYTQLQEDYQELNASYQDHLRSYSEGVNNIRNLTYVIAALTAILIIVTTYLSKRAYCSSRAKINRLEEE